MKLPHQLSVEPKFRSGFEKRIARHLSDEGIAYGYESLKLNYTVPARAATYRPDFILPGGIIVEAKGRFRTAADRQKLILVKEANPEVDLRLLFQNPKLPIYKGSKTTYADWANTHGFTWSEKRIPDEWLKEAKAKSRSRTRSH